MAPSVTLDTTSDFDASPATKQKTSVGHRTLLLSPPSLSSHPEKLNAVVESHDRIATDIQMLDRLSLGLVSLPESTYDVVIILTDADGTRTESQNLLGRNIFATIVKALKPNGKLRSQDGRFASEDGGERTEAILAGLILRGNGEAVKPDYAASQSVPLRLGKAKRDGGAAAMTSANGTGAVSQPPNGKRKSENFDSPKPAGVGFVDFSDDFGDPDDDDDDDDDELIDEDTLLDETDLARPIIQRKSPRPRPNPPGAHSSLNTPSNPRPLHHSPRMPPQIRQAPPGLQRLHVRAEAEDRSGRHGEARRGRRRPAHAEAGRRRAGRGRFHRARQGGQLWELRAR